MDSIPLTMVFTPFLKVSDPIKSKSNSNAGSAILSVNPATISIIPSKILDIELPSKSSKTLPKLSDSFGQCFSIIPENLSNTLETVSVRVFNPFCAIVPIPSKDFLNFSISSLPVSVFLKK